MYLQFAMLSCYVNQTHCLNEIHASDWSLLTTDPFVF